MENIAPEVKSYIYQTLAEFQPFTTPNTVVAVVAKDPLKLLHLNQEEHGLINLPSKEQLKKMHRISITLAEDGTEISSEGLNENIFVAIRLAKEKMLKTLNEIQDDIISNEDRQQQIRHVLGSEGQTH